MVHHYADKNKGLIWQLGNAEARELVELDLLPADTALAAFNEFRVDNFWTWTKKEVETSGIPSAQSFIRQVAPLLALQGIQLPKLSVHSPVPSAMWSLWTSSCKIVLPGAERALSPPTRPGLVLGVKNATLFELLKSKLPMARFSEKAGRKTRHVRSCPYQVPAGTLFHRNQGLSDHLLLAAPADAILQAGTKRRVAESLTSTRSWPAMCQPAATASASSRLVCGASMWTSWKNCCEIG